MCVLLIVIFMHFMITFLTSNSDNQEPWRQRGLATLKISFLMGERRIQRCNSPQRIQIKRVHRSGCTHTPAKSSGGVTSPHQVLNARFELQRTSASSRRGLTLLVSFSNREEPAAATTARRRITYHLRRGAPSKLYALPSSSARNGATYPAHQVLNADSCLQETPRTNRAGATKRSSPPYPGGAGGTCSGGTSSHQAMNGRMQRCNSPPGRGVTSPHQEALNADTCLQRTPRTNHAGATNRSSNEMTCDAEEMEPQEASATYEPIRTAENRTKSTNVLHVQHTNPFARPNANEKIRKCCTQIIPPLNPPKFQALYKEAPLFNSTQACFNDSHGTTGLATEQEVVNIPTRKERENARAQRVRRCTKLKG